MKRIIAIIAILTIKSLCNGQEISSTKINIDTPQFEVLSVVQYNNHLLFSKHCYIGQKRVINLTHISPSNYPQYKVALALKYVLQQGTILLNYDQILKQLNIDDNFKNFVVAVDDTQVDETSDFLMDKTLLNKVIVYPNQKILNIITVNHQGLIRHKNKLDADHIRMQEMSKKKGDLKL